MHQQIEAWCQPNHRKCGFNKEFPFLYNLDVSFENDFDLHQINLKMVRQRLGYILQIEQ